VNGADALAAELATYPPSAVTVRVLDALLRVLPGAPSLPAYTSVAEAAAAVVPAMPAAVVARAGALTDDPVLPQALRVAQAVDTGDAGLALVSGVRGALGLFFGGQDLTSASAGQQRADAALKALAVAWLVTRLIPRPPAERLQILQSFPAGQELLLYFAAIEVALPFRRELEAAPDLRFVRQLMAQQSSAVASKLLAVVGRQGVEDATATLEHLLDTLDDLVRFVQPHTESLANSVRAVLPAAVAPVGQELPTVVAAGADALPCYRYLCARLAAESRLALARIELAPDEGAAFGPALPAGSPFAAAVAASRPAPPAPAEVAPPAPAPVNPFAAGPATPVAPAPAPAPANPFAAGPAAPVAPAPAPANPFASAPAAPVAPAPAPAPANPFAAAPATPVAPASAPVNPFAAAPDDGDAPPPPPPPSDPPPPPLPIPASARLTGTYVAAQDADRWLVFAREGHLHTRPPRGDAADGAADPVGCYLREPADRLQLWWPDGRYSAHALLQEPYAITLDGARYWRADFNLEGHAFDGRWRGAGLDLVLTADGGFVLDSAVPALPSGRGRYALGAGAIAMRWASGGDRTLSFCTSLRPDRKAPARIALGGWMLDRA
jgi:hypothetical protein